MQPYLRTRQEQDRRGQWTGLAVTVAVHAIALVICLTAGLKYLDPPPPETSFLIDFEEELQELEKPVASWCRRPNRPMSATGPTRPRP